jgi:hypothetical protein
MAIAWGEVPPLAGTDECDLPAIARHERADGRRGEDVNMSYFWFLIVTIKNKNYQLDILLPII